jgi:hypothetical protein
MRSHSFAAMWRSSPKVSPAIIEAGRGSEQEKGMVAVLAVKMKQINMANYVTNWRDALLIAPIIFEEDLQGGDAAWALI